MLTFTVDLKYTYPGQRILLQYEGKNVTFTVVRVATEEGDLSNDLSRLNLVSDRAVHIANWDTKVRVKSHDTRTPAVNIIFIHFIPRY